jgi:3-phenylpropionate/cinnamic acid dioxygenase small subunit
MDNAELRWVADQLEIHNLLSRVAQLADVGDDLEEYVDLFTDDGYWEPPEGSEPPTRALRGRAELLTGARERRATGLSGPGTFSRHVITNIALIRTGDNSASAHSYWHYYTNTNEIHQTGGMGTYDDEFRRTAGGWRIASRISRVG